MMRIVLLQSFFVLLHAISNSSAEKFDCDEKFSRISKHHTACLRKPANASLSDRVSESSRKYIVNLHNYYRSNVHRYSKQPTASNMQKMYWDEELAVLAQKWASNCLWSHDKTVNRNIPGSYAVGQNLGKGHSGWGSVIRHWQSEVRYLKFGKSKTADRPIGHYTQMVWAGSSRIGCGYARCNRTSSFYVCNYGPTGNFINEEFEPYKAGEKASSCPWKKVGGLCDCQGKVCKNGGTLNLNTCTCQCLNKPWLSNSEDCSLDCKKAEDSFVCESKKGQWGVEHCTKYVNVPYAYCPITCKLCPKKENDVTKLSLTQTKVIGVEGDGFDTWNASADYNFDYENDTWWESVLNNRADERTTPIIDKGYGFETSSSINLREKTTASVKQPLHRGRAPETTPAQVEDPTTLLSIKNNLPACESLELAKCGQPSERGYYDPKYCTFGLDYYCPAMCGKCAVSQCQDYNSKVYKVGEAWMNEYGQFRCTSSGVKVRRGCYIEKAKIVLNNGDSYSYMDGYIRWQCDCSQSFSLSCKGIWTRRRH